MTIDYGFGLANIDQKTDIRYGYINCNNVDFIWEDFENVYFHGCPKCGNEFSECTGSDLYIENTDARGDDETYESWDFKCLSCSYKGFSDEFYSEEVVGQKWNGDEGYLVEYSESMNCFVVIKSPYYTLAKLCSPCCPGAGDLDSPSASGEKTYCLGREYFENSDPPYEIFSVRNGEKV